MTPYDFKVTLWNGPKRLIQTVHAGFTSAQVELSACKMHIARGQATHYEVEAMSPYGRQYVDKLRKESE